MITKYIAAHEFAWTEATIKSESSRLKNVADLLYRAPQVVYETLVDRDMAPYTIKTTMLRISHFRQWIDKDDVAFTRFMKKHSQLFRNVYTKESLAIDFATALKRIEGLSDDVIRNHALFLLKSGLRISESYNVNENDMTVKGKGGKSRKVFIQVPKKLAAKSTLRRALKKLGLKPHSLRKLFATRLIQKGAELHEVCKITGWSNLNTAMSYLQSKSDDSLGKIVQGL